MAIENIQGILNATTLQQNGTSVDSLISSSISGKQDLITSSNKLSADLVDDTSTINKFVSASDITNWNSKQDSLPTIVNDRYLHTNSSTGDLEWSNVSGMEVVELSTESGTLTEAQYQKLAGNNCIVKYGSSSSQFWYLYKGRATGTETGFRYYSVEIQYNSVYGYYEAYQYHQLNVHSDKSYTISFYDVGSAVQANRKGYEAPEDELLGLQVGSTYYNNNKMLEMTWSELKTKKDNSQLIPGMQYRITDYVTKSTQLDTLSAEHPFDIIVTADSSNKLNERARAIQHNGDTYFANSTLNEWQIWYCIDNDNSRFAWASGKCIYAQEGRTLAYFYRNPYFDAPNQSYPFAWSRVQDNALLIWTVIYTNTENPTTETKAYSSYSGGPYADEYTIIDVPEESGKGVIYKMIDEFNNEAPYDFKNILYKISNVKNVYTFNKTSSGVIDGSLNLEENNGHTIQSINCKYNRIKPRYLGSTSFLNWIYLSGESFNNYFEYGSYHCHFGNRIEDTYCSGHNIEAGDNILRCNFNGDFIHVGDWATLNEFKGTYIYTGNHSRRCYLKGYHIILGTGDPSTTTGVTTIDYIQNIVSESSLNDINIVATTSTNDYLQNIVLHPGLENKTITVDRGLSYTTNVYPVGSTDIFA